MNPEPKPKFSGHRIGIVDADGEMSVVEADELRICVPTAKCIKFWANFFACLVAIGIGIFFMVFQGPTSVYFYIGEGLLSLGIGILIPSPKYENLVQTPTTKDHGTRLVSQ